MFSDEAKIYSDGQLIILYNRHNCHYWSDHNPHWHRTVDHQNRWNLMVWCGIINGQANGLIGPCFFERNVDRDSYLLRDQLPEMLENVDLMTRRRM